MAPIITLGKDTSDAFRRLSGWRTDCRPRLRAVPALGLDPEGHLVSELGVSAFLTAYVRRFAQVNRWGFFRIRLRGASTDFELPLPTCRDTKFLHWKGGKFIFATPENDLTH